MPKQSPEQPQTLAEWRDRQGLNQSDAAKILGISQGYYNRLERRIQVPRRTILKRIAVRTGVPVADLMGVAS